MAPKIRIITQDGVDFYDFANVNSKVRLIASSFRDQQSKDGVANGVVTFDTINKADTQAEIIADIKTVENLLELHKRYAANPHAQQSVYIDGQAEGGQWKQSRIVGWSRIDHSSPVSDVLGDNGVGWTSTWTIQRVPFWEDLSTTNFTMANGCNMGAHNGGGQPGFVADPGTTFFAKGTAPGKIISTNIVELDLFRSIDRFWFGFKDQEDDLLSGDYWPEMSCSFTGKGIPTLIPGHSVFNNDFTDTGALDDKVMYVNFGTTEDYAPHFYLEGPMREFPNATQKYRAGKYLVLLRMRLTDSSTECRVNMFQNWGTVWDADTVVDTFQDVYITDDEFHFYEMGVMDYPPEGYRDGYPEFLGSTAPLDENYFGFGAERISGSGNLYFDYVVMIPYEHFFSWKNIGAFPGTGTGTTPEGYREMFINEEGYAYGFSADHDSTDADPNQMRKLEIELNNWHVPTGPDLFYIGVGLADPKVGVSPVVPETMDNENFKLKIVYRAQYWSFNSG